MSFFETVEIIKVLEEDEFGETLFIKLNGVFGMEEEYGIAEPGGFYAISNEDAAAILAE